MKILVIDDVGLIRHQLEHMLGKEGHRVLTASSGEEGLRLLSRDHDIRAVFVDMLMPGMNGVRFLREAQKIDRVDDLGDAVPPSFIVITAIRPDADAGDAELLERAAALGVSDIIHKPLRRDDILGPLRSIEDNVRTLQDPAKLPVCEIGRLAPGIDPTSLKTLRNQLNTAIQHIEQLMESKTTA